MKPMRIANPAPPVSRVSGTSQDRDVGCNYQGRLGLILTLIDRAEYAKALYQLNQLAGFIRPLKRSVEMT